MYHNAQRKTSLYGKAAKLDEKVKALEETLKTVKAEREAAYKEQLKEERKAKKNQAAQRQKDLLKQPRTPENQSMNLLR